MSELETILTHEKMEAERDKILHELHHYNRKLDILTKRGLISSDIATNYRWSLVMFRASQSATEKPLVFYAFLDVIDQYRARIDKAYSQYSEGRLSARMKNEVRKFINSFMI